MPRVTRGATKKAEEEKESRLKFVPPLPQEVIHMILKYLHQETDRNTLAGCMRVSSAFNAVTAPLLYRSISICDKTAKGDVLLSAPMENGQPPRKSLNKKTCLTYVRVLRVLAHTPHDCPHEDIRKHALFKKVDVLRLSFPTPERRDQYRPPERTDHLAYGGNCCPATSKIQADKIVLSNTNISQALPRLNTPGESAHTLVTAFSYNDIPTPEHDITGFYANQRFEAGTAKLKRAIYICWLPHSAANLKLQFDSYSRNLMPYAGVGGPNPRRELTRDICSKFIMGVVGRAMRRGSPNDIIVVNIAGLGQGMKKDWERRRALESTSESHWKPLVQSEIARLPHGENKMKSPEEANKISIKYVSMYTYLTEYDWRGEFTEEEVKRWVGPNDKRQF